jgi:hypothetical protein
MSVEIARGECSDVVNVQDGSRKMLPPDQRILRRIECAQESERSCGKIMFVGFFGEPHPRMLSESALFRSRDYRVKP